MRARERTTKRTQRAPPSARATAIGPPSIRLVVLLFAALLALTLALAPRAEAYVYWGGVGDIGRANLDGSGANHPFIATGNSSAIAVDAAHVYWSNLTTNTIGRASLDGTGVDQSFIAGVTRPEGLAVDDEHVYWSSGYPGTIGRANLDGSGVDKSFITRAFFPGGVAVDDEHVYWSNFVGGTIGRANLDGSSIDRSFIAGAINPAGVAVDDGHVYWANSYTAASPFDHAGAIGRANLDGSGADQRFITIEDFGIDSVPYGVAVDAGHLYWTNDLGLISAWEGADGTIGRANLDGSGVDRCFLIIDRQEGAPTDVAVDALGPQPSEGGGLHACDIDPSNDFSFGRVKKNRRKGTAKLTVIVPVPGALDLAETKRVRLDHERTYVEGKEKLSVKPKGKAKKKLNHEGKAQVKTKVTFTPNGGEPNMQSKKIKLVKR